MSSRVLGGLKVLVVDHVPESLEVIQAALAPEEIQLFSAQNAERALEIIPEIRPRVVLSNLLLPSMGGLELMQQVLARDPATDFVLMTSYYSTDSAVDAIKRGARDVWPKPLNIDTLRSGIRSLVEEARLRNRSLRLDHDLVDVYQFENMVGRSPVMLEVFAKIRRVAPHFRSVLINGNTGTGKELVAHALHRLSPVAAAPFAVCNCSALVETLLESELFGYVSGAFTGAVRDKQGLFEYANGGTVFLDEVGELSLSAQAKLLRVLQNHEVQRVGSPLSRRVDVRVIAATHRDLRKMTEQGLFREDLFYRLSIVEIPVPSLAQRKEDLPLLERHFLEKYSRMYGKEVTGLTRRAQVRFSSHHWPGNVRELENVISASCILCDANVIDLPDLPESFQSSRTKVEAEPEELVTLEAMQQRYLLRVLDCVGGNKAKAAEILGVGRNTVYQMLSRIRAGGAPVYDSYSRA